ncbi:MAG: inorganic diphosphatase [Patescibacteria group bacterium]|nr:inorganic diphosphatase [Patescibacteria group bacterium]
MIKKIPFGRPEAFNVVVEVAAGGSKKYAYDGEIGAIKLSRVLYDGLKFPFNYGFVAATENYDGGHLDAFIFSTHPLMAGMVAQCRAVGMLQLIDHGKPDHKILAVPLAENRLDRLQDIGDVPIGDKQKILDFYRAAASQWDRSIQIEGFADKIAAKKELLRTLEFD